VKADFGLFSLFLFQSPPGFNSDVSPVSAFLSLDPITASRDFPRPAGE